MHFRKVTTAVPSSSVVAAAVQQPVSPPVITTNTQVVDSDNPDWTYDPNEPRYCICNQVSYGDMVACDNSDVSRTFIARCVSLRAKQKYLILSNNSFGLIFFSCSVLSNGFTIHVWVSLHRQKASGTVLNVHLL